MNIHATPPFRYRTIWISDLHLGTRRTQCGLLLEFLAVVEAETIYLVGDIIDNWALGKTWHWQQSHNDVIQALLKKARRGTRLVYIPGNHDEQFRDFVGMRFGRVTVCRDTIHLTASGKRYLVLHGDEFDCVVRHAKWLALLGDQAYSWAMFMNHHLNRLRRLFNLPYWSLSSYLKQRVKRAVEVIGEFEAAVVREARKRGADGVVCGHIHTPQMRDIEGVHYCNDGDWVESCSALVEHRDGRLEIVRWADMRLTADISSLLNAHPYRDRRLAPAG